MATWGASEIRYPAQARTNGKTLIVLVTPEDADADLAIGWSTSATAIDPRTDGYGVLIEDKSFKVITPDGVIPLDSGGRMTRPMQYLVAIVLLDEGAAVYICSFGADSGAGMEYPAGIPAFPDMRPLFVTHDGTSSPLYPYISAYDLVSGGYPGGHRFQDLRVLTVDDWTAEDALAAAADRFTRADSALTLGGSWTSDNGTFGIASNEAYPVSVSGFGRVWMESGESDFILAGRLPIPSNGYRKYGFMLRGEDDENFIRLWFDSGIAQLQTWVEGSFGDTIANIAYSMAADTTYDAVLIASGNKYRLYINGVDLYGSWAEDVNSRFLTATKHGLYILEDTGYEDARWGKFAVYPLEITAPVALQTGASPTIFTAGSVIASDTFTDTDGTSLDVHTPTLGSAWTEHVGGWTIEGNRLLCSTQATGFVNLCTMDVGASQAEATCTMHVDATATEVYAGICFRFVDVNNYLMIQPLKQDVQIYSNEVELIEVIGGVFEVVRKDNLGLGGTTDYFADGGSYDLKVQVGLDDSGAEIVQVWIDGEPRISYALRDTSPAGTRWGFAHNLDGRVDDGTAFDGWTVKAL